ncbi:MAG: hypothetical protein JWN18_50 [Parcubacteria group bacterium]|nr:hypothetical protein [Parcubacteria group bacterium]
MFSSRQTALLILAITAVVCSRVMFSLFNDPEGPNLLVVMGMAAILYFLSLAAYIYNPLETGLKNLVLTIFIQVLLATGLYFWLS